MGKTRFDAVICKELILRGKRIGPADPQPDSFAKSVAQMRADHNALLAALRDAGLLEKE